MHCALCLAPCSDHFCNACAAIERHRLQRRHRAEQLRLKVGCEHLWTYWTSAGRKHHWERECVLCRQQQDDASQYRPTDDNDVKWAKEAFKR